ncbi:FixH family protein [Thiolinea disciformis]|uniref:FixH family protein n=1 Tax=Thiolinea disciformis TaxID=125614 RepID=UPI0003810498|nr:FixH family protein [Thiolinea disciformis]
MNSYNLFLTLAIGVAASIALFFLFFKALKWNSKLSALVTILIVQIIYLPLVLADWPGMDVFAIHFAFFVMTAYGLAIINSRDARRVMELSAEREGTAATPKSWFHWAPATIVGFFLLLAMVDGLIITLASKGASAEFMERFLPQPQSGQAISSSFTGPVAHNFHQKYQQFNHYVAQVQEQKQRGWAVSKGWAEQPIADKSAPFAIEVQDKQGTPVTGARVDAQFLRPSDQRLDQKLTLSELQAGSYGADIRLPVPGAWSVVLTIKRGEEVHEVKGDIVVADPQ